MAGQLWVTGQCGIFVGPAGSSPGQASFLGFAKTAPQIPLKLNFQKVHADPAGRIVQLDDSYMGQMAFPTMTLTYWNQAAYIALTNSPRASLALAGSIAANTLRGTDVPGDRGSLMITEALHIILYIQFPFAAKAAYGGNFGPPLGMELGYRFPCTKLVDHDPGPEGTADRELTLGFECIGLPTTSYANSYGALGFVTYDGNVTGLPAAA
jgi:hypothetical protein